MEVVITPLEDYFEDGLVNVSRALTGRSRLVYAKIPAGSSFLDGLLSRRLAMGNKVRLILPTNQVIRFFFFFFF